VLSKFFSEFTLGKVRDLNSELLFALVQGQKWKIGRGGEKEFGRVGREKFAFVTA
jgi:hypothetical protein